MLKTLVYPQNPFTALLKQGEVRKNSVQVYFLS